MEPIKISDYKRTEVRGVSATSSHNSPKRILVVDDDPDIRHLIAIQMRLFKYEPIEAPNGKAALQLLEGGNNFDLVITDASMPELDGFGLTNALRTRPEWSQIPILMVTALDDTFDASRAYLLGVNKFLGKPLDRNQFKTIVQGLLQPQAA